MDLEAVIVIVHLPETKSVEEVKKQGVQWPGSLVPDIYRPTARMHASLPDDVHFIIPVHQVAAAGLPIWHNIISVGIVSTLLISMYKTSG